MKVKVVCQIEPSKRDGIKISFRRAPMAVISREDVLAFIDDDRAIALVRALLSVWFVVTDQTPGC